MTTQVQLRRGSNTAHSTFTGAEGEMTVVTDDWSVRVHDGVTPGGHPISGGGGRPNAVVTAMFDPSGIGSLGTMYLNGQTFYDEFTIQGGVGYGNVDPDPLVETINGAPGSILIDATGISLIYQVTIHSSFSVDTQWPAGAIAFGTHLDVNYGTAGTGNYVMNSSYHTRNIAAMDNTNFQFANSGFSSIIAENRNKVSWTDTYVLNLAGDVATIKPGLAAFAYNFNTTQIMIMNATMVIVLDRLQAGDLPPPIEVG